MLFNSLAYILLVILSQVAAFLTKKTAWIFLSASFIFYAFAGWFDTFVFIGCVIANWLITRCRLNPKIRIFTAIFLNIGCLTVFKYGNFLLGAGSENESSSFVDIALPLGISFYTFQMLAYQIDVSRGISKEATSFKSFALFISFFPQLVAGPIVRSKELLPQIERLFAGKKRRLRLISYGLALFLLGLFKKVFIADSISPFVDEIFLFGPENAAWAWLGGVLFAFQIYCDFSGYSDMAIGSAYLLGIRLPVNFRTPYLSQGPREFWQRWHITLSTWIRDYLYIPLGGSKGGRIRAGMTVIATMAIAGLWHGADITFIIWGTLWGVYIFIARLFPKFTSPSIYRIAPHFIFTVFLWVLFRSPDINSAIDYYKIMLGFEGGSPSEKTFFEYTDIFPVLALTTCVLYAFHYCEYRINRPETLWWLKRNNTSLLWGLMICLIVLLILLPGTAANPFIYFRF